MNRLVELIASQLFSAISGVTGINLSVDGRFTGASWATYGRWPDTPGT